MQLKTYSFQSLYGVGSACTYWIVILFLIELYYVYNIQYCTQLYRLYSSLPFFDGSRLVDLARLLEGEHGGAHVSPLELSVREYGRDDARAKCQGVPSAKASQVPRRLTDQPRRDANTQASAADPLAFHGRTKTLTTARTHVPSAKACQVPGRAKCKGVVQESAKARVRACKGRLGMGWVWAADAGGRERR